MTNKAIEFVRTDDDLITVRFVGYCMSQHVGISRDGKVYVYCTVNDRGRLYDFSKDGAIKFE